MIIVGAGLAGLIAAHAWPTARVVEAAPSPRAAHAALLRFRSDAVARLVGIEFRKVRVRKGVWDGGRFVQTDIRLANLYSRKVLGGALLNDRSIWSLDPVDRWVAPEDLYAQLAAAVGPRIAWGTAWDWGVARGEPIVSTAPLEVALRGAGNHALADAAEFSRAPIFVQRFRVPGADVYQTVYFPTEAHSVYRASITGSLLIVEHAGDFPHGDWAAAVFPAFGLHPAALEPLGAVTQAYGKIAPIPEPIRRRAIVELTQSHGIYSLGRFATWRNLLLDDVVSDIDVIKRLIRLDDASGYALRLNAS